MFFLQKNFGGAYKSIFFRNFAIAKQIVQSKKYK